MMTDTHAADAKTRKPAKAALPEGWRPMETAHQDGKPLWLLGPEGQICESHWRITRQVRKQPLGWHEVGLWGVYTAPGAHVPFEPIGWRPLYE